MNLSEYQTIVQYQDYARDLGLIGWEAFCLASPKLLAKVCNGIGPEWFPPRLRRLVDALNPSLTVVAMIHDHAYYMGNGTYQDFLAANAAFAANARLVANDRYPWYSPLRYIVRHQGRKFALLCDDFGLPAYNAAIAQRKGGMPL